MNISVQSWQDLQVAAPVDPRTIILNANLGVTPGSFVRSTNLLQSAWVTNTVAYTGSNTKLVSLDLTDASTVTEANQWTIAHQMVNAGNNIPASLNKVAFLRAGKLWDNQVEINFPSAYTNAQLTFRDNIGTSGQFLNGSTGSIPAFLLGNASGPVVLHVTILQPGTYSMVIGMVFSSNWTTFEMEWIVLP